MAEFVTFPLFTQTRKYQPPKMFFQRRRPDPIFVRFKYGEKYRVRERLMWAYEDGRRGSYVEYTILLEHPDAPGCAFGFAEKYFGITTKRTQRTRQSTPGIPAGSIYAGRPSQWGNPAKVGTWYRQRFVRDNYAAVSIFYDHCKELARNDPEAFVAWIKPLIDRDICCWCSPNEPCHVDILLSVCRFVKPYIDDPDFRTLIPAAVDNWPEISCIIVL